MRRLVAAAGLLLASFLAPALAQGPAAAPAAPAVPAAAVQAAPAVAAAPAAAAGVPELTAADAEAWLDGFVPIALARGGIAGAVVVIVKDGQVLVKKGYGYSDLETRAPVDPDRTLFRPGSISKLFTWTAVMQQVEAGKIDLDADINTYLDFKIPPFQGKPLTMRHMMTHTPGFEEFARGLITSDPANGDLAKNLKRWTPTRVFAPGTTPAYSNYATGLAGYVVQRVSGMPFDDYVEQRILTPLQMANSSFRQPLPARLVPMMSKGYSDVTKPAIPFEIVNIPPAGSLSATGADMANFMIAHLQQGRFGDAAILKPETAKMMHETETNIMAPLHGIRLGFYQQDINGERVIAHGGDTQAFHSLLSLFLDRNVGLYQSVNSSGIPNGNFRQALFEAFADRYFPAPRNDPAYDPKKAAAEAAQVAGTYTMARGGFSSFLAAMGLVQGIKFVVNEDGTVSIPLLTDAAGKPKRYRAIGPFLWREVGGHDRLGAKVVDGKVQFISTEAFSGIIVMKPADPWRNPSWVGPAVGASVFAVLLTLILWPVSALVRRSFGQTLQLTGQRRKAYRGVRIGGLLVMGALAAWGYIAYSFSQPKGMEALMRMDGFLMFAQGFTAFATVGGMLLAAWNLWATWKGPSGWFGKLWSLVLLLAFGMIFYFALIGRLMAMTTNY